MKQELFSFFKLVQFSFYIFRTRTNDADATQVAAIVRVTIIHCVYLQLLWWPLLLGSDHASHQAE